MTFYEELLSVSWEPAFLLFKILARGHVNMEADYVVWAFISKRLSFRCVRRYEPCPCQVESKMPDLPVRLKPSSPQDFICQRFKENLNKFK